jgi:hypothetical protein
LYPLDGWQPEIDPGGGSFSTLGRHRGM